MIGRLAGRIVVEEPDGSIVLDVNGVGYEVATPIGAVGRAQAGGSGDSVVLFVHTHVREDSLELFGFASQVERGVFRLLLGVPNVGPKTALNVLSALPPPELSRAVHAGDLPRLNKIPGIGKKSAERLVLELKEKLPRVAHADQPGSAPRGARDTAQQLAAALTNMGYRPAEADKAIKALGAENIAELSLTELLRKALAYLAS
jgi:Holliday junction DNA helicase RuvA